MEGPPLEDAELVERAKRGDVDAYGLLVRRYQDLAVRVAYVITGEGAEAEDAAQDAFVKAYYALDRLRAGVPFRPWLLRIVTNEALNKRKSASRRARLTLRVLPERDDAPAADVVAGERADLVRLLDAVQSLPDHERLVVAYRYFLGLSEEEIADTLGVAPGTVKSRSARALVRLRTRMIEPIGGTA